MATWHRVSGDRGLGMALAGALTAGPTPLLHTDPPVEVSKSRPGLGEASNQTTWA